MPQLRAMMHRSKEKEQKQQHINRTENILLKGCITEGIYDQKSSENLTAALHVTP